jgi:addiction module HigA family antidote
MNTQPNIDSDAVRHPGNVLKTDFLAPMGITQYRLAKVIGVTAMRVHEICHETRGISPDTALRLARALGTSPQFWLALQADFDTEEALKKNSEVINRIKPLVA